MPIDDEIVPIALSDREPTDAELAQGLDLCGVDENWAIWDHLELDSAFPDNPLDSLEADAQSLGYDDYDHQCQQASIELGDVPF